MNSPSPIPIRGKEPVPLIKLRYGLPGADSAVEETIGLEEEGVSLSNEATSAAILRTSSAGKDAGKTAEVVVVVVVVILGSTEVTEATAEVLGSINNNKRIA